MENRPSKNVPLIRHITLRVGRETVDIDKKKLMDSSEYFKALFSGHFSDSDAKELDLSKDVDNMADLKLLLSYIDTGKCEITESNLNQILKLCSFFCVNSLEEKCALFLKETLTITNCLPYYFLATTFGLPKSCTRKLEVCLETRFHDLLIFEDHVTSCMDEYELKQLLSSGFMKYCSRESIFNFLLKWLSKSPELTSEHLKLVSDIVQYVGNCESIPLVPLQTCKKMNASRISRVMKTRNKANSELRQLMSSFLQGQLPAFVPSCPHNNERCVGVFTFSERISFNKETDEDKYKLKIESCSPPKRPRLENDNHVPRRAFDLCVYQPDSRAWYHLATFNEHKYYSLVDGKPLRPTTSFKGETGDIICDMVVTGKDILFSDISDKLKLVRYNIGSGTWSVLEKRDLLCTPDSNFRFAFDKNGSVYLIKSFEISNPFERKRVLFLGYTVDFSSMSIVPIFSTKSVDLSWGTTYNDWSQMAVRLSSVSQELLILYTKGTGDNIVCLVNLSKQGHQIVNVLWKKVSLDPHNTKDLMFLDVDILETEDRFKVVSAGNEELVVKCEYKFHSNKFEIIEDDRQSKLKLDTYGYSECSKRSNFRDSYWMVDRAEGFGSYIRRIKILATGGQVTEQHTPPPFVKTIAVYAAEVEKSLFWGLEPVIRFLELENDQS